MHIFLGILIGLTAGAAGVLVVMQVMAKNGGLQLGFGLELGTKSVEEIIESWRDAFLRVDFSFPKALL